MADPRVPRGRGNCKGGGANLILHGQFVYSFQEDQKIMIYFQHRLSAERWFSWRSSFHSWRDNGKFYLVNFIPKTSYLSHLQWRWVHSSWSWSTPSASLGILVCHYQHIPAKQCHVIQSMHCYWCNLQWQRWIQGNEQLEGPYCMANFPQ